MKKIILLTLFYSSIATAQKEGIVYPKGKWYFGAEIGTNKITSFEVGGDKTSFQGGVLAEYYFGKQWSVEGKIKYFKTGVSFRQSSSWLTDSYSGDFKGDQIAFPIAIKWEFRLYKNLKGNLKTGLVLNVETYSSYKNYFPEPEKDFKKFNLGFMLGYGLNYFISEKNAIFIDYEGYIGGSKGDVETLFGNSSKPTLNTLFNLGYKHQFKF
ncbi:outer membrane beta-barrel protein [Flavobacterium sp.]|uniref:outer membrane beta-barrel protein n=1 Tax=Flavobacterium sp. TaxID=239 RepID=UPI002486F60F|nr:outer membrane beta-barrel protein [Flavobacterium sp.]MDI1317710.1 outer membrane beta-barrel protein [Flavobacterium sp.]